MKAAGVDINPRCGPVQDEDYHGIVQFSASLVDSQLFVHYLAVVLLELRHLHPCYNVRVIRSTDGETRHYNIGQLRSEHVSIRDVGLFWSVALTCASGRQRRPLMKLLLRV